MDQYQHDFVDFLISQKALLFGSFTLKSGRVSPYFFNAGQFDNGAALSKLGEFYAAAIVKANVECDVLFGPAYKGIPIVSSVAIALSQKHGMNYPFCFNRKEKKSYGEKGELIGSPLEGRVLLVDDVVSAGTTVKESAALIAHYPTKLVALVTALDRQERGDTKLSAIDEIKQQYQIATINIIKLQDVIEYLHLNHQYEEQLQNILTYQEQYGSSAP